MSHPLLRGSEALCMLLRYLAERALENPGDQVKEHQIATAVFARDVGFDPRTDSTVRVQTSRLRAKLAEYYSTSELEGPWIIELPKGSYSLVFRPRVNLHPAVAPPLPIPAEKPIRRPRYLAYSVAALSILLLALLGWRIWFFRDNSQASRSLEQFWGAILTSSEQPLVVFSNAEFVGRPETGIRYRKPGEQASQIFDQYTGTGEVFAIHDLDNLFSHLRRSFILKRGRLLNWDDTKNRDLIFVGSPSENLPLRELPLNRNFTFGRSASGPRAGDLGIVNLRPQPGEERVYLGSPNLPILEDYALIEMAWEGYVPQPILLLAGTTTLGTEAAVEFVCQERGVSALLERLGSTHNRMPVFSAVLHVRVNGGVPLDSSIVALRRD